MASEPRPLGSYLWNTAEARRLANRFEWHYTPKHGSWLDMAESELAVLTSQCLSRRIPDKPTLEKEVAAWERHRNKHHAKSDWQFTTENARVKLRRLEVGGQHEGVGEEASSFGGGFARGLPGRLEQVEDGMPGEGEQIEGGERHGEKLLAVPEIVFELIAVVFQNVEALVLDFPFHRARPQATISATLSWETGRLVTQAIEYLIFPLASTISKPIQLTNSASLPSRIGTASIQR